MANYSKNGELFLRTANYLYGWRVISEDCEPTLRMATLSKDSNLALRMTFGPDAMSLAWPTVGYFDLRPPRGLLLSVLRWIFLCCSLSRYFSQRCKACGVLTSLFWLCLLCLLCSRITSLGEEGAGLLQSFY